MSIDIRQIKFTRAVGARIQAFREMYGWTKRDFHKRFGLVSSTLYRIEKGFQTPSLYTVAKIARALDTTVLDLMADTEFSTLITEENLPQMIENIKRLNTPQRQTILVLVNQFLQEKDNEHP